MSDRNHLTAAKVNKLTVAAKQTRGQLLQSSKNCLFSKQNAHRMQLL